MSKKNKVLVKDKILARQTCGCCFCIMEFTSLSKIRQLAELFDKKSIPFIKDDSGNVHFNIDMSELYVKRSNKWKFITNNMI